MGHIFQDINKNIYLNLDYTRLPSKYRKWDRVLNCHLWSSRVHNFLDLLEQKLSLSMGESSWTTVHYPLVGLRMTLIVLIDTNCNDTNCNIDINKTRVP